MMNIIPITPATLKLITKLNNGVAPHLGDEETFYVYRGEDQHAEVINLETLKQNGEYPEYMTVIEILYIGD